MTVNAGNAQHQNYVQKDQVIESHNKWMENLHRKLESTRQELQRKLLENMREESQIIEGTQESLALQKVQKLLEVAQEQHQKQVEHSLLFIILVQAKLASYFSSLMLQSICRF